MRRGKRRPPTVKLQLEILEDRTLPSGLTLTPAAIAAGYGLSSFASGFSVTNGAGPVGVAYPNSGGVLVSDGPNNVRLFPKDADGQAAASTPVAQNYGGTLNAYGLALAGGKIFMAQYGNGQVVQLNDDGTFNQIIVGGMRNAVGIVANPNNGHLFVSSYASALIMEVDPVAHTSTPFVTGNGDFFGLAISSDGSILYGANSSTNTIQGFYTGGVNARTMAYESHSVSGGFIVGVALGYGKLAGNFFVTTDQGRLVEVNDTAEALLAVGGGSASDGQSAHFLTADPNGTLLVDGADAVMRLAPPEGGGFANLNTTLALGTAPTASVFGQPITFTANLQVAGLAPTPTGTIGFFEVGTRGQLGTGTLSGNNITGYSASFTTSALSAATHTIRAVYSGDGADTTSSDQTAVTVNPNGGVDQPLVVTTTLDESVAGDEVTSLREAMTYANANPLAGADTITFNIPTTDPNYNPSNGSFTLTPDSALPAITHPVIIDGYSQPGARPNTLLRGDNAVVLIELNGQQLAANGLSLLANDSTIRGLAINSFLGNADIFMGQVNGAPISGDVIAGNFIGVDPTGEVAMGYANGAVTSGVSLAQANDNTIGGLTPADRNLISGNSGNGVSLFGVSSGNVVQGNYIGADASGTVALGNAGCGIVLGDGYGSLNNIIGGTAPGAGNLISGNRSFGIDMASAIAGNRVEGNCIGTDASGSAALGNGSDGLLVKDTFDIPPGSIGVTIGGSAPGAGNVISGNGGWGVNLANGYGGDVVQGNRIGVNAAGAAALGNLVGGIEIVNTGPETIGGATAGAGNVISGNHGDGVQIRQTAPDDVVQGNLIGTDITGTAPLGNAGNGVYLGATSNHTIGGTTPGAANIIAFNGATAVATGGAAVGNGVLVVSSINGGSTGDALLGNSIYGNVLLGIDLGGDGVTPNTPDGPHAGADNLQNFPVLTSAVAGSNSSTITGTLNSTPSTPFRIEFFASAAADPSAHGQGQTSLGATSSTTDGAGNASFTAVLPAGAPSSQLVISATATDLTGNNTSEFSSDVTATVVRDTTTVLNVSPATASVGATVTFTATVAPDAPPSGTPTGTIVFSIDGVPLFSPGLAGGQATYSTSSLSFGSHTVTARYIGNVGFASSTSATYTLVIGPIATTTALTATPENPVLPFHTVTFTATVTPASGTTIPGGYVSFSGLGTNPPVPVDSNGVATFTTSPGLGNYSVVAMYIGSPSFTSSSSAPYSLVIAPIATTTALTATPENPVLPFHTVTFTATVTPASGATIPSGYISFSGLGTNPPVQVDSHGVATFTVNPGLGNYSVVANYIGNSSFTSSTSAPYSLVIAPISTTTALTATPANPILPFQTVTFTATVTPASGTTIPSGYISFSGLGANPPVQVDSNGVATFTTSPGLGNYSVVAMYIGNSSFTSSTSAPYSLVIAPIATTTALIVTPANPILPFQTVTFTATVAPVSGATIPSGYVSFSGLGTNPPVPVDSNGVAAFTTSPGLGNYSVVAMYIGSLSFTSSSSAPYSLLVGMGTTTTTVVSSLNPSTFGAPVTFTATVAADSGAFDNGGIVQFAADGSNIGSPVALSGGIASISDSALTVGGSPHAITATYSGDTSFAGSGGALSGGQTVNQASTTTAANPTTTTYSSAAQTVTLSATLGSERVNEGVAAFTVMNGGAVVGQQVPETSAVSGGVATARYILPAGLALGAFYTINVSYSDSNFISGLPTSSRLIITPASATAVASPVFTAFTTATQTVTLSATVTVPQNPSDVVGEGAVAFTVNNGQTVTGVVGPNGIATVSYDLPGGLAANSYPINAHYNDGSKGNYIDDGHDAGSTLTIAVLNAPSPITPRSLIAAAPGFDLPTYSWSSVPGANHYYLYVLDVYTTQAVVNNPNVGNVTAFTPGAALTPGHVFSWYVAAVSANNAVTAFSGPQSFSLASLSTPVQISPTGRVIQATTGYDTPTYSWSSVSGAHHYYLYVLDATTGQAVVDNPNVGNGTAFTPTAALTPGHEFTWYVAAVSANNAVTNFSGPQVCSLASLAAPTQISSTGSDTPTYSWSSVSGANHYYLYVLDATTNQPVVNNPNVGNGTAFAASVALTPGHSYTWYVGAVSTNNAAVTFSGQTFLLNPLSAPTQISPTGQAIPATAGFDLPTYSWSSVPGANHYYLYVLDATTNQPVVNNPNVGNVTAFTPTAALTPGDSFTWYVAAVSSNNAGQFFSNAQNFSLAALLRPAQNGPSGTIVVPGTTATVTFSWNAVAAAAYYSLSVLDTTTGATISNPNVTGLSSPVALPVGHSFTWSLAAVSANRAAPSSSGPKTFALAAAKPSLGAAAQIGPSGSITATSGYDVPTFNWSSATAPLSITSTCSTRPRTCRLSTMPASTALRIRERR